MCYGCFILLNVIACSVGSFIGSQLGMFIFNLLEHSRSKKRKIKKDNKEK